MDEHKTIVVFRKWRSGEKEVFALFPNEAWSEQYCASYAHIGQHGGANYNGCISQSKPATPEEYKALHAELTSIGYNLDVRARHTRP